MDLPRHFIVLDTETTGVDPKQSDIIEIGFVEIKDGEQVDDLFVLVKPDNPISGFITHLTGITPDMVADADTFEDLADEIDVWLHTDVPLITYNGTRFDLPILQAHYQRFGLTWTDPKQHIDLYKIAKQQFTLLSTTLAAVAEHLNIQPGTHRVESDCQCIINIITKLQEIAAQPKTTNLNLAAQEPNPIVRTALLDLERHINQITAWTGDAANLPCDTDDHYKVTVEASIHLKQLKSKLDGVRKQHTKPLKDITGVIDTYFRKHASVPIDQALETITNTQQHYLTEQHLRQLAAEQTKAAIAAQAAEAAMEAKLAVGAPPQEAADHANEVYEHLTVPEPAKVTTMAGTAKTLIDYEIEIITPGVVPMQFWSPDVNLIRNAITASDGQLQIPGVTFKPVFTTRTRRS